MSCSTRYRAIQTIDTPFMSGCARGRGAVRGGPWPSRDILVPDVAICLIADTQSSTRNRVHAYDFHVELDTTSLHSRGAASTWRCRPIVVGAEVTLGTKVTAPIIPAPLDPVSADRRLPTATLVPESTNVCSPSPLVPCRLRPGVPRDQH